MSKFTKKEEETISIWTGTEYVKVKKPSRKKKKKVIKDNKKYLIILGVSAGITITVVVLILKYYQII